MGKHKLTDKEKKAIHDEVKRVTSNLDDALVGIEQHEKSAKKYQSLMKIIFFVIIAVVGSSFYGVLELVTKTDKYIESRIVQRIKSTDRLDVGLSLASNGDWTDALYILDELWDDIEKDKSLKVTREFKSLLLDNLVWVLASVEIKSPSGEWVGKNQWDKIRKDSLFIREYITSYEAMNNPEILNSLALCEIKYSDDENKINIVRNIYTRSVDNSENHNKSAALWNLSLVSLLENNEHAALYYLKRAESIDPQNYLREDWIKYKASYINSVEFIWWDNLAKKQGVSNLEELIDNTYLTLMKKHPRKQPST